jgi:hypothetical protein
MLQTIEYEMNIKKMTDMFQTVHEGDSENTTSSMNTQYKKQSKITDY